MTPRLRITCPALILALALSTLPGCMNLPPDQTTPTSAYGIGDRARADFAEIVVSLPFRGANAPYQNLHLTLTAFINPTKPTHVSAYQAETVVERCQPRIAVQLSHVLGSLGEQSLQDTPHLRQLAQSEAQTIINQAMTRWQHGADYKAEVAVASLYWTDPSVGKSR